MRGEQNNAGRQLAFGLKAARLDTKSVLILSAMLAFEESAGEARIVRSLRAKMSGGLPYLQRDGRTITPLIQHEELESLVMAGCVEQAGEREIIDGLDALSYRLTNDARLWLQSEMARYDGLTPWEMLILRKLMKAVGAQPEIFTNTDGEPFLNQDQLEVGGLTRDLVARLLKAKAICQLHEVAGRKNLPRYGLSSRGRQLLTIAALPPQDIELLILISALYGWEEEGQIVFPKDGLCYLYKGGRVGLAVNVAQIHRLEGAGFIQMETPESERAKRIPAIVYLLSDVGRRFVQTELARLNGLTLWDGEVLRSLGQGAKRGSTQAPEIIVEEDRGIPWTTPFLNHVYPPIGRLSDVQVERLRAQGLIHAPDGLQGTEEHKYYKYHLTDEGRELFEGEGAQQQQSAPFVLAA